MSGTPVVTRFAPSPTGFLHIGGARTALFNWLYARGRNGKFLLRIEDTDRARSTTEATGAILDGMAWLGLDHDGEAVSQLTRTDRHTEVAHSMLAAGHAYKCFSTPEEIRTFREQTGNFKPFRSPWRDASQSDHPDTPFAIRIKAPRQGRTEVEDQVQGRVTFENETLDDMIVLRSDGTPTYMLAVVVDDHDMSVTHVIRGDDHLANAARQSLIYHAMDWKIPVWAHIPLIHGPDGRKLSKRHGALGVSEYRAMGFPAAAMRNYLARLGWSHGDDEFFTDEQARKWFDLSGIGKSPSRLDFKKLGNLSARHIASADDAALLHEIREFLSVSSRTPISEDRIPALKGAMFCLKTRSRDFGDLIEKARFVLDSRPLVPDARAAATLDSVTRSMLQELTPHLQNASWTRSALEAEISAFADTHGMKPGKVAGSLRAALSGAGVSPSAFDMMLVIGRDETIARLNDLAG